jgi:hypothetical protein
LRPFLTPVRSLDVILSVKLHMNEVYWPDLVGKLRSLTGPLIHDQNNAVSNIDYNLLLYSNSRIFLQLGKYIHT